MASTGLSSSTPPDVAPAKGAAVVVGIASHDDEATIGTVARHVSEGLYPHRSAGCIVIADGGSTDRTLQRAYEAVAGACAVVTAPYERSAFEPLRSPYHGLPGRAAAIRAVLRTARDRDAKACAFVDARVTSLAPEWLPRLIEPVFDHGYDYVSPYYVRHPHEGAITKSIIYPMFRALYGLRIRQPAAGEFGCSTRLIPHLLDQGFWDGEEAETGIDLWLASAAAAGGFRVCEAVLGCRTHASRAETPDLSTTFAQVVGALFADLEARAETWQRVRGSMAVPAFGLPPAGGMSPPPVDAESMLDAFRLGFRALRDVWAWIVLPRVILELKRLAEAPAEQFRLDDDLWAQIVYDFALAYRARSMPREHLLGALTPLYLGWLAAFVMGTSGWNQKDIDDRVEQLCVAFETKKPYLISGWRWPERFRA